MRPVKDFPYQMMYKTTVDGWDQWRTTHARWRRTTVDGWDRWRNPYQMAYETAVNGWDQWRTTHTIRGTKHCWCMRSMNDYPQQLMYKTTVYGWDRWRNPYQMVYETTVNGWDQWRNTLTRWFTHWQAHPFVYPSAVHLLWHRDDEQVRGVGAGGQGICMGVSFFPEVRFPSTYSPHN